MTAQDPPTPSQIPPLQPDDGATPIAEVTSDQLFGAGRELLIRHVGDVYRLRITRTGKLILTK
jgi:hemin uptake protein HemP